MKENKQRDNTTFDTLLEDEKERKKRITLVTQNKIKKKKITKYISLLLFIYCLHINVDQGKTRGKFRTLAPRLF